MGNSMSSNLVREGEKVVIVEEEATKKPEISPSAQIKDEKKADSAPTSLTSQFSSSPQSFNQPKSEDIPAPAPFDSTKYAQNPGVYEDLHKKCKDLFPICFDGCRVILQKPLSSHFQIVHNVSISNVPENQGYKLNAVYVGTKQYGPQEAYPVLQAESDLNGNTNAVFIHQVNERCKVQLKGLIQNSKFAMTQFTGELRGTHWTLSGTMANPDLIRISGIGLIDFMRRVTPRLDLGAQMTCQKSRLVPGGMVSDLQWAARYNGADFTAVGAYGNDTGVHLSYWQKYGDDHKFGTEWQTNARQQESVATLGYQFEHQPTGLTIRSSVDSNWTVRSTVERRLYAQMPFNLFLSGLINQKRHKSQFGIGFSVG